MIKMIINSATLGHTPSNQGQALIANVFGKKLPPPLQFKAKKQT